MCLSGLTLCSIDGCLYRNSEFDKVQRILVSGVLIHKQDIYVTPSPRPSQTVFWTWQGHGSHQLMTVVVVCMWPAHSQVSNDSGMGGGGDSWVSAPSWGAVGSWRLLGESQSSLRVWPLVGQPGSCGRLHPKNMWVAQNGLSGLLFFLKKGKQGGCLKWGGLGDTSGWGWSWGNAANMTQIHCKKFSRN